MIVIPDAGLVAGSTGEPRDTGGNAKGGATVAVLNVGSGGCQGIQVRGGDLGTVFTA